MTSERTTFLFFLFLFFPKRFPSLVLRKAPIGLKNAHQKVFYTKMFYTMEVVKANKKMFYIMEVVKARTRGDDISISVLQRRL